MAAGCSFRNTGPITSNLDFSEWIQAFPNKLLGVATIDRIRYMAYLLTLEDDSHRDFKEKKVIVSTNLSNASAAVGLKAC